MTTTVKIMRSLWKTLETRTKWRSLTMSFTGQHRRSRHGRSCLIHNSFKYTFISLNDEMWMSLDKGICLNCVTKCHKNITPRKNSAYLLLDGMTQSAVYLLLKLSVYADRHNVNILNNLIILLEAELIRRVGQNIIIIIINHQSSPALVRIFLRPCLRSSSI